MAPARVARTLGLFAGPIVAALAYAWLPAGYTTADGTVLALAHPARATASLAAWMAVWWMTEAIPIYVTALMPVALLPLLQAVPIATAARPYGHHLIFLFLGGFMLSLAMERWRLHARIALRIVRVVGTRPDAIVAGFMLATATLSMWVSNTATAVMMLPIAISIIEVAQRGADATSAASRNFAVCLLLGIAYAASIGGMATIIGTPPNVFLVSYVRDTYGQQISFLRWLGVGLPLTAVLLPVCWWLLTRVLYRVGCDRAPAAAAAAGAAWDALGPMSRGERLTGLVFLLAVAGWITRPWLVAVEIGGVRPLAGLDDAGIAVLVALALFVLPVRLREREFLLDWATASRMPWGILILFGGGLSLAAAIDHTGVGSFLGHAVGRFGGLAPWLLVLLTTAIVIFLTELTSNLATTVTFVPIVAAIAVPLGVHPFLLIVPTTLAASCAFMLPVATPPNAIVFGSGRLVIGDMVRAGIWLNLLATVLVTLLAYLIALPLLGTTTSG